MCQVWGSYTDPSQRLQQAGQPCRWQGGRGLLSLKAQAVLCSQARQQQQAWAPTSVVLKGCYERCSESPVPCNPVWSPLCPGSQSHLSWIKAWKMIYTNIFFKASKFIAIHFLIAFTMEIVQIFILNSMAFERSQSFYLLQSFMKIYIKIVLIFLIQTIVHSKRLYNAF